MGLLSANIRIVDVPDSTDFSVSLYYLDGTRFYALQFGSQADGDPIVQFLGGGALALEGAGSGCHLYDLRFDPLAASVDLFVDGTERISNFLGPLNASLPEVAWGGGESDTTGQGNYNLIRFDVGQAFPVPEPGTLSLLTLGLLAIAFGCRRKQRLSTYSRPDD